MSIFLKKRRNLNVQHDYLETSMDFFVIYLILKVLQLHGYFLFWGCSEAFFSFVLCNIHAEDCGFDNPL